MKKTKIFVYGSLKRGFYNGLDLPYWGDVGREAYEQIEFLGTATSSPEYTMISCGSYPAIIEYGNTSIVGEVWSIPNVILERIDRMEYGAGYYKTKIDVNGQISGTFDVYCMDQDSISQYWPRLKSGVWTNE